MMKRKIGFMIVALLMTGIVSGELPTEEASPAPAPIEYLSPPQSETEMSPSDSETKSPTMPDDYINHPSSQFPETEGERSTGGGGVGIAFGAVAAASMIGVGGYVLKKRRENIRRSRFGYAATEII